MSNCVCQIPPFHFTNFDEIELGDDDHWGEVSLHTCKSCGTIWVRYYLIDDEFSGSGRWWRAQISPADAEDITADSARNYIEQQKVVFKGGSYFQSDGYLSPGPVKIF